MTADLYCSRSDVTARMPLGSITSAGGLTASASATSNAITYDGHGLETDDPITVRAPEGGTLPSPLVAGTTYYARRVSNAAFELAATAGGAAIDLTTAGTELVISREPDFDYWIEFYSRWADTSLPGHLVPLEAPIHPLVIGIVADLVAKRMFNVGGWASATQTEAEVGSKQMLDRFAAGLVLRGASATASASLAVTATLSDTTDARGWGSGSLP